MDAPSIVVAHRTPGTAPRTWSSTSRLRIGRLADQDVPLGDITVSRRHAELLLADEGWVVHDLGSTNGTHLNSARLGRTVQRVRRGDVLKIGDVVLHVESVRDRRTAVSVGDARVEIAAVARRSWDEAVDSFGPNDGQSRDAASLLPLMRAGCRLSQTGTADADLRHLLDEAVAVFGAQRGGVLFVTPAGGLHVRCVSVMACRPVPTRTVSKTLATMAVRRGQSLLFKSTDAIDHNTPESVLQNAVASVICAALRFQDQVFGVLYLDRGPHQQPFTEADLNLADSLAAAIAAGVERIQMRERQHELLNQVVTALAHAVEMRDQYTGDHTHRVTAYSLLLAEELNMSAEQRRLLRTSSALHDIGKIAIDDKILRKPGRLSDGEVARMRTHVTRGAEILQTMPGLAWALPVVRSHHERWDGRGYPDGLKGEEIPLAARVVAVADAFDAMTSDRPYRKGMPADVAFEELRRGAGGQFDPECIAALFRVRPRIEAMLNDESIFQSTAPTANDTSRNIVTRFTEDGVRQTTSDCLPLAFSAEPDEILPDGRGANQPAGAEEQSIPVGHCV
ncbi:MAG TPA: HD domain-containing phosphohydrolase [Gemmataceae bacterium]|nr:HD domain-containing phosphohydrolase [Gemmataceae bacterium]